MTPNQIQSALTEVIDSFPEEERFALTAELLKVFEGKDVGTFKGDISSFKQLAIDAASTMSKPVTSRRNLEKAATKKLDKLVKSLEKELSSHLSKFKGEGDRKISETQFRKRMKDSLKLAYLRAYDLGTEASGLGRANKGLTQHSSDSEKKWVQSAISQEQKYFNKFLNALVKGESKTKSKYRISQYANALRSVFESSRVLQLPDGIIIHWVLQSNNPCSDCRLLHRMSPYTKETLPTTPKAGRTRCLGNCYCKLRVVKAKATEVTKVRRKNRSSEYLLKKLKKSKKK